MRLYAESTVNESLSSADRVSPDDVATLPTRETEVLVIGGGPAGAAMGYWLAEQGHEVAIVERKHFPREKTCGDGLTPRAVKQLDDMGLGERLTRNGARQRT
ncbi:MAG: FAD-dependent oxidoreductase [Actinobacteria bacterium]|nr:FAD-dependent oxidoreductase [Actinomycetota bacterium]